jgi:RHH-type rel operon transcriptional repressor/antitoxin RelB
MVVAVRLPADLERRLDELAKRTGRPKSFYIRQAVEEHLEELEEAYWADEAVRQWRAEGGASRPLADLKAELEL